MHAVVKTPPGRAALHALSARQQLRSSAGGVAPRVAGMGTLGAPAEVAPPLSPLRFHVMTSFWLEAAQPLMRTGLFGYDRLILSSDEDGGN